jgi:hypothetical protein
MTLGCGGSGRGYPSRGGEGIRSMQRASGLPPPCDTWAFAAAMGGGFERLKCGGGCTCMCCKLGYLDARRTRFATASFVVQPRAARPSERLRKTGGGLG